MQLCCRVAFMFRVSRALKVTVVTIMTLAFTWVLLAQDCTENEDGIQTTIERPDLAAAAGLDDDIKIKAQLDLPAKSVVAPAPRGGDVVQALTTAHAPRAPRILPSERLIALGYWSPLSWLVNNPATAPPALTA
jgi:hypothetical protein